MADRELLARYVEAFERYDMDSLTALLHEDATQSMPPYELWLQRPRGDPALVDRARARLPRLAAGRDGGERPAARSGSTARAPTAATRPWALQLIEAQDGRIVELSFFLDTPHVFPLFGLPLRLDDVG